MSVQKGRPSRFWVAVVGVALLLLGIILVMVILLSARLRQAERVTVGHPAAVGTAPAASPPGSASSHTAPVAARPSATPTNSQRHAAKTDRTREKPARAVERPVKVVEKVVEKETKVVEKEVKVVEKPVKVTRKPARERPPPTESNGRAPVPTTGSSDRKPVTATFLETGLPNQLTYAGKLWNASDLVTDLSADLLASDSRTVDGHTIYHDEDAASPFPHVYAKVAGETDQYVRYVPTSP